MILLLLDLQTPQNVGSPQADMRGTQGPVGLLQTPTTYLPFLGISIDTVAGAMRPLPEGEGDTKAM